jgi:glucose-1-phosphate thymidylyltransferase
LQTSERSSLCTSPDGLAQAFILAEDFLDGAPSTLILRDNIFFGHGLSEVFSAADARQMGATVFGYHVNDPEHHGVVDLDNYGNVNLIIEKSKKPALNYAVTGLYFVDGTAPERAKNVKLSARGEFEITWLLEIYLEEDNLTVEKMSQSFAWLDMGTHGSLHDA